MSSEHSSTRGFTGIYPSLSTAMKPVFVTARASSSFSLPEDTIICGGFLGVSLAWIHVSLFCDRYDWAPILSGGLSCTISSSEDVLPMISLDVAAAPVFVFCFLRGGAVQL